jgi:RND family efflux transporter MFP subunit
MPRRSTDGALMTPILWFSGLLLLGLPDRPTRGADVTVSPGRTIVLLRCTLGYGTSSLLGASSISTLQDCLVKAGDRIRAGQVLGRIQDREARADMDLRQARAESDIEVRLCEAKHAQALARLKASEALKARHALSLDLYNIDRLAAKVAELEVESAVNRRHLARLEFEQAKAAVRTREIVSPHDGIVLAVLRKQGEPVAPNSPVFHVVDVDRIWVTGSLDVKDAWQVQQGQSVAVSPVIGGVDLDVERKVFPGCVVFVDQFVDPRSQTCKVVAEIDNRQGMLRAGLGARMEVLPPGAPNPAGDHHRAGPGDGRPATTPASASPEGFSERKQGSPAPRAGRSDPPPTEGGPRTPGPPPTPARAGSIGSLASPPVRVRRGVS